MRTFRLMIPVLLAFSACCCEGGENLHPSEERAIVTDLVSLSCPAQETTLTLHVTAAGPFQAYAGDGLDWVVVTPAYSADAEADVTVKVSENLNYADRTTDITIKCGTTRHRVPLTQAAAVRGETSISIPDGYHLVWQDEFDTTQRPNTAEWWYETGAGGWGNNELQNYAAGSFGGVDLASISDGTLKITAQNIDGQVRSIRMNTKRSWTYGWFEARLRVSDAQGAWPAFWMMPQNFTTWPGDGEIDIMEYAIGTQGKNRVSSSIHCGAFNWPNGTQKTHAMSISDAAGTFHTYALEWSKDQMVFYVDGQAHFTFKNDGQGYSHWPFDNPFYLKLNLAWGGNMGGTANAAQLPAVYEVDYVRVFQKD